MARNRHRRGSRRSGNITGVILLVAGVAMLAAIGVGYWWVRENQVVVDKGTNCPVSGPPRSVHMFIIDRSDPVSGQQAQRIRQVIADYRDTAEKGDRFDFYVFEGNAQDALEPKESVCSPGREVNPLIENERRAKLTYDEKFARVIDSAASELLVPSTLKNSPLLESLRAATQTSFGPFAEGGVAFRLTLVSDMIQNSDAVSHYKRAPDFEALAASQVWAQLRPNLKGAEVDILYVLRPAAMRGEKPIQNRGHQLFWEELIVNSGGRFPAARPGIEPI
jgi:hypothetical protein